MQAIDARAPLSVKRGGLQETSEYPESGEQEWRNDQRRNESGGKGESLGADTRNDINVPPRVETKTEAPRIGPRPLAGGLGNVNDVVRTAGVRREGGMAGVAWDSGDEAAMAAEEQEAVMAAEGQEAGSSQSRKYRDHVDSELKRMNDAFALSLVGLEGRPRRRLTGRTVTGRSFL